jgi:sialate O-acetylesterase
MNRLLIFLCSMATLCWEMTASAAITLPSVIGDNMVLQRGCPLPIWGWADKGEEVAVAVAGRTLSTKADNNGRWKVAFAKLDTGRPLVMTIRGSSGSVITVLDQRILITRRMEKHATHDGGV